MEKIEDGGTAFPYVAADRSGYFGGKVSADNCGMSLRDWFAGQVLGHLAAQPDGSRRRDCKTAYEYADMMIEERAKKKA